LNADEEQQATQNHDQDKEPFGGKPLSDEELYELAKKYPSSTPKFPDSNGSEIACLMEDGTIEILHTSTANDTRSHGTQSYPPHDKYYEYQWKRHGFDNPQGKNHVIKKRWDAAENKWIELGEYWY
jgi:hypothetical protein